MRDYCPNCQCPSCQLITRAEKLKQQRADESRARAEARESSLRQRRMASAAEYRRECAMIWMLVNTAKDQLEANLIIQKLADALSLSRAQVNTRRAEYARILTKRTNAFNGELLFGSSLWASLPGTQGTDLPEDCPTCSRMKTAGRKCKRCDYRRSKKTR